MHLAISLVSHAESNKAWWYFIVTSLKLPTHPLDMHLSLSLSLSLYPNSVLSISLFAIMSVYIASIFPPYSSDTESETGSASNESPPRRFSCSIDTIFPPYRSPSQSPPRISFSIETFFPPARSPSQSDGSENYEEIFPIDPFISTSSRRTRPMRVSMTI